MERIIKIDINKLLLFFSVSLASLACKKKYNNTSDINRKKDYLEIVKKSKVPPKDKCKHRFNISAPKRSNYLSEAKFNPRIRQRESY